MTSIAHRAMALLPPLVVAGVIGGLLSRAFSPETERTHREDAIRARWGAQADFAALAKDLEAFVRDFGGDPEARWLAAEAYVRIGDPAAAFDAVFSDLRMREDRRTPRRFAGLMLERLSWMPGEEKPAPLLVRATLARIDAGDPEARTELRKRVATMQYSEMPMWFIPATRAATASRSVLAEAIAARADVREFRIAAGGIVTGPKDKRFLDLLLEVVASDWRIEHLPAWRQVCRAVGSSMDPKATEILRQARNEVTGEGPFANDQRATLDVALALSEDPVALDRLDDHLRDPENGEGYLLLYATGLVTRWSQGDSKAGSRLKDLWSHATSPLARLHVGYGVLLSDMLPPPEIPADEWAEALAAGPHPAQRVIPLAWHYRRRDPQALAATVLELERAIHEANLYKGDVAETANGTAVLEILRAWLRWS